MNECIYILEYTPDQHVASAGAEFDNVVGVLGHITLIQLDEYNILVHELVQMRLAQVHRCAIPVA